MSSANSPDSDTLTTIASSLTTALYAALPPRSRRRRVVQSQFASGRLPASDNSISGSDTTTDDSEFDDDEDTDIDSDDEDPGQAEAKPTLRGVAPSQSTSDYISQCAALFFPPSPTMIALQARLRMGRYRATQDPMIGVLFVGWIILRSYYLAHNDIYNPRPRSNRPQPIRESVMEMLFPDRRGEPAALISSLALCDIYELEFPDLSTPAPPTPQSFTLTPRDWVEPSQRPGYMPPIHPTPNAASPSIASDIPSYQMQMQIANAVRLAGLEDLDQNESNARLPNPNVRLDGLRALNQLVVPAEADLRRVKRVIKPLPKRAVVAVSEQEERSVVGRVVETAMDVGSAIFSGVKRLRDGLEEGRRTKKAKIE